MKVEIPDCIINDLIDANIIQSSGSMRSLEGRSQQATRLQWHFAEYVTALIGKELRNRKLISYDPLSTQQTRQGNQGSDPKKQGPVC